MIAGLRPATASSTARERRSASCRELGDRLTAAQRGDVYWSPANAWEDAILTITPLSIDGGVHPSRDLRAAAACRSTVPTSVSLAGSINENSAAGTLVGLLTGIDPDASEAGAPART